MSELSSLLGGSQGSQTDMIVQSYLQTQQPKLDRLKNKQTELEKKKTFFTTLNTKLNSLVTQIDKFTASGFDEKFAVKKVDSTDPSFVTASADGSASLGSNTVKVNRLASQDILVSDRTTSSDDFGDFSGTFQFDVEINGDIRTIEVTLDNTETFKEAMQKISTAINAEEDFEVSSSVINDTSTTSRLSLTSSESGASNKILFSNDAGGILSNIGLDPTALNSGSTSRVEFTDTSAGYKSADPGNLNSEAEINGITVTRDSNTLNDVLEGYDITLKNVHETEDNPVTLTTDFDVDEVTNLIKPILDAYNDMLSHLQENKNIRRSDMSANTLFSNLRGIPSSRVTGLNSGDPDFITTVGITTDSKGNLKIDDKERIEELLKDDPQKLAQIFTSADGFAEKLNGIASSLKGSDGILSSKRSLIQDQIDRYDNRHEELEKRINRQAENLRKQYETILSTFLEAEAQYSSFQSFSSPQMSQGNLGGGGGFF